MSTTEALPTKAMDNEAFIRALQSKLVESGVPFGHFGSKSQLMEGYMPNQVATLLRPFESIEDAVRLDNLFYIGMVRKFFNSVSSSTLGEFFAFCSFLGTPEGQEELNHVNEGEELKRRTDGKFTSEEQCLLFMFEHHRKIKEGRAEREAKIHELDVQLKEAKAELESFVKGVPALCNPLSEYVPLTFGSPECNKRCWKMYDRSCRNGSMGIQLPLTVETLESACVKFAGDVMQRHVIEFLNVGSRKEALCQWIQQEIAACERVGETRLARQLRYDLGFVVLSMKPIEEF